ncbi:hypothetical protein V5O48_011087 [Marasmius crinis-equi]|uniref:Uncharacterized protein n=1 Tax=Marasmius crinis-equi TaxID=585013 RepID=A0ABR3F6J0_9AGAR
MPASSGRPIRDHTFIPLQSVSVLNVRNLAIVQSPPPPQQTRKGSVNDRDPDDEALIGVTESSGPLSTSYYMTSVTFTSSFYDFSANTVRASTVTSILTAETILLAPSTSTSESTSSNTAPKPSSKSDPPLGAIIGGIVGGITVVTGIFVMIFFRKRGCVRQGRHQNLGITALSVPPLPPPLPSHETNREKARPIVSQWSRPEHRESDDADAEGATPEVESLIHNREPADSTNAALAEMRAHIELMAERMAKMEAELAPPDYVSRGSE